MKYRQWGVVIVCILIGIGTVAVVRGQDSEEFLATAREPDLIRLLDDLRRARPVSTVRFSDCRPPSRTFGRARQPKPCNRPRTCRRSAGPGGYDPVRARDQTAYRR